jgi:hypothetical protein
MKIRTDPYTLRLKYVVLLALLIDVTATLLDHPAEYWSHPKLTNEGNQLFIYFAIGLSTLMVFLSWQRISAAENEVASPFLSRIIRYLFSNA